jgi:beta-lactamase regulating signal transducer with metallopeptidase domain
MNFDTILVIDYIIPDSPRDFEAILLWILIILFVTIATIDIRLYLDNRKTSKKIENPQQKLNTIEQMKKSKEERMHEIVEIRNKVDKIIEINKL